MPSPVEKWNLHLHKAGQQQEAWSALKHPGRRLHWPWTSGNRVGQHRQMTWHPHHHWRWKLYTGPHATWILCFSALPPDSGSLISKGNAKFAFIRKHNFGPLNSSPVLFVLGPGKTLLTRFLVQEWLDTRNATAADQLALWRCRFHFSTGLGTCTQCQNHQYLVQGPWYPCPWLASKLAWP